jgi:RNase P protein component
LSAKQIDAIKSFDGTLGQGVYANTSELNAIKRIIRESWEPDVKDSNAMQILDKHIDFMTREMRLADYEVACMQNVVKNSKHMSKSELHAYTKLIEALAIGYESKFGPDITSLLIPGVTLLSKDLKSVRKHYNNLLSDLYYNLKSYDDRIERENGRMCGLTTKLQTQESSMFLFRMFRKKEIATLRNRIKRRTTRISRLQTRKVRYESLANRIKSVANSYSTKQE